MARFSYQEFVSNIGDSGLAFQNRFEINISKPKGLNVQLNDPVIHMLCKSVSVPGINIATSQERLTGEAVEIPYDRNFAPAMMTFYTPNDFENKLFFDRWIDIIQDPKTRAVGYYQDYVSPLIEVSVIDRIGKPQYKIKLIDAHPKQIGDLNLDNESTGVYVFNVTFDYHYYTTEFNQSS